jgi:hypothetical protein
MPGNGRLGRSLRRSERRSPPARVFQNGLCPWLARENPCSAAALAEMLDRKVALPRPVLLDEKLDPIERGRPRYPPAQPINYALRPAAS